MSTRKIHFKATRKRSDSCEDYRQIEKEGDLRYDLASDSDDVITLYTKDNVRIGIECNLSDGKFCVFFDGDQFKEY